MTGHRAPLRPRRDTATGSSDYQSLALCNDEHTRPCPLHHPNVYAHKGSLGQAKHRKDKP